MTIDIIQPPPSAELIDQEFKRLQLTERKLKRNKYILSAITLALGLMLALMLRSSQGWISEQFSGPDGGAVTAALAVVGAFVVTGTFAVAVAVTFAFTAALVGIFAVASALAGSVASDVAGAVTGAVTGAVVGAIAGIVADSYIYDEFSMLREKRTVLDAVPEESELCVEIVNICKVRPECDDYRVAH